MPKPLDAALALALAATAAGGALAQDGEACATVHLSDPGWTDITSTNAVAGVLLGALGYEADVATLSVPVGYEAMKTGDVDVFLGNWMPRAAGVPRRSGGGGRGRGADPQPHRRQVHPRGARLRRRAGRERLRGPRGARRRVRPGDLRHRERRAGQPEHPGDDREGRLRPGRLGGGRVGRAGDAGAGRPRRAGRGLDRVPRLGAAPDEHRARADLPLGRRRLLRPRLRRRRGPTRSRAPAGPRSAPTRPRSSPTSSSPSRWRTS